VTKPALFSRNARPSLGIKIAYFGNHRTVRAQFCGATQRFEIFVNAYSPMILRTEAGDLIGLKNAVVGDPAALACHTQPLSRAAREFPVHIPHFAKLNASNAKRNHKLAGLVLRNELQFTVRSLQRVANSPLLSQVSRQVRLRMILKFQIIAFQERCPENAFPLGSIAVARSW
jgi:hypothetical protein